MGPSDVPSDALVDLKSADNKISVWRIEADRSNLHIALTAVASNRDRLDKLDYTLVDESIISAIPIALSEADGASAHASANANLHRDLVELTVARVAKLAERMMPLERFRLSEKEVRKLLVEGLDSGQLDRGKMSAKLLEQLK
jgi:hypothetical protein